MRPLGLWERRFFWAWLLLVSLAPISLDVAEVQGLALTESTRWLALAGAAVVVLLTFLVVVPPSSLSVGSWLRRVELRLFPQSQSPQQSPQKESNHEA